MTSYSKTATTIWLYDVPRSIAEDLRIAFLQSTLFWQASCAKSKTKACTEISAWTITYKPVKTCLQVDIEIYEDKLSQSEDRILSSHITMYNNAN